MALSTCPECSGSVSTKAFTCPHCGAPVDFPKATVPDDDDIQYVDRDDSDLYPNRTVEYHPFVEEHPFLKNLVSAGFSSLISKAAPWTIGGILLGAIIGFLIVFFDSNESVPILDQMINSRIIAMVSSTITALVIIIPIFAIFDEAGCVVSIIVLFLFGSLIFWIGVGTAMVIFPYIKGIFSGGVVFGVVAGGFGLIVETIRLGSSDYAA